MYKYFKRILMEKDSGSGQAGDQKAFDKAIKKDPPRTEPSILFDKPKPEQSAKELSPESERFLSGEDSLKALDDLVNDRDVSDAINGSVGDDEGSKKKKGKDGKADDSEKDDEDLDDLDDLLKSAVGEDDESEDDSEDDDDGEEGEEEEEKDLQGDDEDKSEKSVGKKNKDKAAESLRKELGRVKEERNSIVAERDALKEEVSVLKDKASKYDETDAAKAVEYNREVRDLASKFDSSVKAFKRIYHKFSDKQLTDLLRSTMSLDQSKDSYPQDVDRITSAIEGLDFAYEGRSTEIFRELLSMSDQAVAVTESKKSAIKNIDQTVYENRVNGWRSNKSEIENLLRSSREAPIESEGNEDHAYNVRKRLVESTPVLKSFDKKIDEKVMEALLPAPPLKIENFKSERAYRDAVLTQMDSDKKKSEKVPELIRDAIFWRETGPAIVKLYWQYKEKYGSKNSAKPPAAGRKKAESSVGDEKEFRVPTAEELTASINS